MRTERDEVLKMGWQPIETAPRDGTAVDLWALSDGTGFRIADATWERRWVVIYDGRAIDLESAYGAVDVTDWMPLPEPPK